MYTVSIINANKIINDFYENVFIHLNIRSNKGAVRVRVELDQEHIRIPQGRADSCTEAGGFREWIVVCIILYNIFMTFNDAWEEEEDEEIDNEVLGEVIATDDGINLRQRVQNNLLQWYDNGM